MDEDPIVIHCFFYRCPIPPFVCFIVSILYYALCIMRIYIHWIVQIKERVVKWCVPQNRLFDRLLRFLCTSLRVWWLYYHVLQGELYGLLRCVRAKLPYQARRLGGPRSLYCHDKIWCNGIAMIKYDVMVFPS